MYWSPRTGARVRARRPVGPVGRAGRAERPLRLPDGGRRSAGCRSPAATSFPGGPDLRTRRRPTRVASPARYPARLGLRPRQRDWVALATRPPRRPTGGRRGQLPAVPGRHRLLVAEHRGALVIGASTSATPPLGREAGRLGLPAQRPICGLTDTGCYQLFTGGSLYSTPATGIHGLRGGALTAWQSQGSEWGPLGYPTGDEPYGLAGGGSYQEFQGGHIYWSPSTGARVITGAIRDRWLAIGGPSSGLGYPTTDTICGLKDTGCYQLFQNGIAVLMSTPTSL